MFEDIYFEFKVRALLRCKNHVLLKGIQLGRFNVTFFVFPRRKGISGSALPYRRSVPTVCMMSKGLLKQVYIFY